RLFPDVGALAAAAGRLAESEPRERAGGRGRRALRQELRGIERAVVDTARRVRERGRLRLVAHPSRFSSAFRCRSISTGSRSPNFAKNSPTPSTSFFQSSFETE